MPELKDISIRKWVDDFSGLRPTLTKIADDVRVGDIAIDTSQDPVYVWQCEDDVTPIWNRIGGNSRNLTQVFYITSSNTDLTPLKTPGMYYVDADSGDLTIYIEDASEQNNGSVYEFRKPNLSTSFNTITLRTPSGQAIGPSSTFVMKKNGDSISLVSNYFGPGGSINQWKYRQIVSAVNNPYVFTVGAEGSDYTSINQAVTFANTYATDGALIYVNPGEYTISSTIVISNPNIKGIIGTGSGSVILKPSLALVGSPMITCLVPCQISDLNFVGSSQATYKTTAGSNALELKGYDGDSIVRGCIFIDCNLGINIDGIQLGGTYQNVFINDNQFQYCENSIDVDSGSNCHIVDAEIFTNTSNKYAVYEHNSTAQGTTELRITNMDILDPTGSNSGEGIKVENNSIFYGKLIELENLQEGIHINNGPSSFCAMTNVIIRNLTNYAVKVNGGSNVGVNDLLIDGCDIGIDVGPASGNNFVFGFSIFANNIGTYELAQRNTTDILRIYNCSFDRTKMLISNISNFETTFFNNETGDRGFTVYGEMAVGSPEEGKETVLGGGDSYTRGMLVYTYDESTGVYTDVSEEARSLGGSTFTFTGTEENNAIYVSSDLKSSSNDDYIIHAGIKASVTQALVKGGGSIDTEYWNGMVWTSVNTMTTKSDSPYTSYSNNIFSNTGSFQIRYDNGLNRNDWVKNDPPSTGTNRRWIRFRIVDGVTMVPIFEQFKLHTNRTEINADGWIEHFGKARPTETLPWDLSLIRPGDSSPGNQDLYISKNIVVGREYNLLGDGDKVGFMRTIPQSCDTSTPILFKFSCVPAYTDAIIWKIYWAHTSPDDNIYFDKESAPSVAVEEKDIEFSGSATAGIENWFTIPLDISEMNSLPLSQLADNLWINIQKVSGGGNVALADIDATYTKWNAGGRIP